MQLEFSTPALLFPAITLLLLAYTNRFLALASLVRKLHGAYQPNAQNALVVKQIKSIKFRLSLIKYMQTASVLSFFICVVCMYCIYIQQNNIAQILFAGSLICLMFSLFLSLVEIQSSTKAIEIELSDMEQEEHSFMDNLKNIIK
jgi:hypothetical protein